MTIHLQLGEFGPPRIVGRTLVLLCAYRGGRASAPLVSAGGISRFLNWMTLRPLSAHVAVYRDHHANPRPLRAQIALAHAALALGHPDAVRTVVDQAFAANDTDDEPLGESASERLDLRSTTPSLAETETVVLVYPDALGLGFGELESRLYRAGVKNIVIVNGRRRIFPLTPAVIRGLRWRRALATTRLIEFAAAATLILVAVVLAGYDVFRKRISS